MPLWSRVSNWADFDSMFWSRVSRFIPRTLSVYSLQYLDLHLIICIMYIGQSVCNWQLSRPDPLLWLRVSRLPVALKPFCPTARFDWSFVFVYLFFFMWVQIRFVVMIWLKNIFFIIRIFDIPYFICIAQQCALRVFMWAQMGLVLMLGLNPTRSASVIPKYLRSRINCDSSKKATILRPNMKKFSRLLIQLGQEVKYAPIYLCQDQNLFWSKKIPMSYYALHRWLRATTV